MPQITRRAVACLLLLWLAACSSTPNPTPTPTRTPRPGEPATSVAPSAVAPTGAPTTAATAAPSPAPAPTSGVTTVFPPDVNPLTGEKVADQAVLERRPLAIKISNSPMEYVRPQSGIGLADLVFEHYAEGGVTRLTAIYLSRDATLIGPVRSGRLIDLELPAMFQSMFACSGYSPGVKEKVRDSDLYAEQRIISPDFGAGDPPFHRVPRGPDVPFEHTLFTATSWLWDETTARGLNARQALKGLGFAVDAPDSGTPIADVQVNYAATEAHVEWKYDATTGRWLRWEGGAAFTDALDGSQVTAANVVVLYVNHVLTDIQEDSLGSLSIQIQLWGTGPARLYRDGRQYEGFWIRQQRDDMLGLTDAAGNLIPLKPGNTWFQVVTLDAETTTSGTTTVVTP
jgi:hypothetical protein